MKVYGDGEEHGKNKLVPRLEFELVIANILCIMIRFINYM
jgi:hypothetical protein